LAIRVDTFQTIATKLDIRQFAARHVEAAAKSKILEAARLTGSSKNTQHWRFILVQDKKNLATLAQDSTTGPWVSGADFAIVVNIDPKVPSSVVDAGRVVQDMQLAAWELGVGSGIYTGIKAPEMRRDFGVPEALSPTVVVGFGYPKTKIIGKKNRKPISELAFLERYGSPLSDMADA
jgi:nitroreductase